MLYALLAIAISTPFIIRETRRKAADEIADDITELHNSIPPVVGIGVSFHEGSSSRG